MRDADGVGTPRRRQALERRALAVVLGFVVLLAEFPAAGQGILDTFRRGMRVQEALTEGKASYDAGQYEAAQEHFRQALALDPSADQARALLGWSQYRLGRHRTALITFKAALRRRPDWEGLYAGVGWSRVRLGRYRLAAEAFQAALDQDPEYVDALVGLGTALFELERYNAALVPLEKAFRRLRPLLGSEPRQLASVRAKLAWTLYYLDRHGDALVLFEEGIAATPDWYGLHNGAGWCYLRLGDIPKARNAFRRALSLKPGYPDAMEGLRQVTNL